MPCVYNVPRLIKNSTCAMKNCVFQSRWLGYRKHYQYNIETTSFTKAFPYLHALKTTVHCHMTFQCSRGAAAQPLPARERMDSKQSRRRLEGVFADLRFNGAQKIHHLRSMCCSPCHATFSCVREHVSSQVACCPPILREKTEV